MTQQSHPYLYQDDNLQIDAEGITITGYRFPGDRKHIPFAAVVGYSVIELGALTGRYRLIGFGFRRPRHFFHWDRKRSSKSHAVALDLGKRVRPVISPDDHQRVLELLDQFNAPTSGE